MASTEEQDVNSQPSPSSLLSEDENRSTFTMVLPKNETPRFESFPPEIRNMIYRHLFPPLCKGSIPRMMESRWPVKWRHLQPSRCHDAYIYHTAILRSNRLIGQEAKTVFYGGGNKFVLFKLTDYDCFYRMISNILSNIAWNSVRKGAPEPSGVAQIKHVRMERKRGGGSLIVAAADVNLICKKIEQPFCFVGWPRAAYSLVALPQLDGQHERLLTMIWLPLKALRERRHVEFDVYGYDFFNAHIEVIDCTGVFEQKVGIYKTEDFEMGSLSESNSDSDPTEDESDGSGSEDSESGDDNSCAEEEDEEEDIEDVDRTANGSDDVAQEESDGDEAGTSGESGEGDSDEAPGIVSEELCRNVSE